MGSMEIFAHVVGEHQSSSPLQLAIHSVISWLIVLTVPIVIGLVGTYILLKQRRKVARQLKRDK